MEQITRSQDSDTSTPGGVMELKGRSGSKMSVGQIPNIQEALRPILDEQKKSMKGLEN